MSRTRSSTETDNHRTKRLLLEIREEVIHLRSQYLQERTSGAVNPQTEQAFRAATIMYYEALREHRNEAVIGDDWEDSSVHELERLLNETTTITEPSPGHGGGTTTIEVPRFRQVDTMQLVRITQEMDDLCKKLGFSPPVNESTPRTQIDDELMERVEEWRQNTLE